MVFIFNICRTKRTNSLRYMQTLVPTSFYSKRGYTGSEFCNRCPVRLGHYSSTVLFRSVVCFGEFILSYLISLLRLVPYSLITLDFQSLRNFFNVSDRIESNNFRLEIGRSTFKNSSQFSFLKCSETLYAQFLHVRFW